jgi:uncharacterized iron-regulated membrane protein
MRFRARLVGPAALLLALAVVSGCSLHPSTAASSAQPAVTTQTKPTPSSKLDPQVAMPRNFPTDVPVYTGARLTAAAVFNSNGQTTFGMEWETLDKIDKVHAFYAAQLSQGDWTIQFNSTTTGTFAASFSRKSNPRDAGLVSADGSSGVTKISLSLASVAT